MVIMPTLKQEAVAKDLAENIGKPIGKAMLDAGYAPETAKTPQRLTQSRGWEELMEKYLPDKHLSQKHREFIDSKKIKVTYVKGDISTTEEFTDPSAVKALDIAYKIKGKYAPNTVVNIQNNQYISLTDLFSELERRKNNNS